MAEMAHGWVALSEERAKGVARLLGFEYLWMVSNPRKDMNSRF